VLTVKSLHRGSDDYELLEFKDFSVSRPSSIIFQNLQGPIQF